MINVSFFSWVGRIDGRGFRYYYVLHFSEAEKQTTIYFAQQINATQLFFFDL